MKFGCDQVKVRLGTAGVKKTGTKQQMVIRLVSHEFRASDASASAAEQGRPESGEQRAEELAALGEIPECAKERYLALMTLGKEQVKAMLRTPEMPLTGTKQQMVIRLVRYLADWAPARDDSGAFTTQPAPEPKARSRSRKPKVSSTSLAAQRPETCTSHALPAAARGEAGCREQKQSQDALQGGAPSGLDSELPSSRGQKRAAALFASEAEALFASPAYRRGMEKWQGGRGGARSSSSARGKRNLQPEGERHGRRRKQDKLPESSLDAQNAIVATTPKTRRERTRSSPTAADVADVTRAATPSSKRQRSLRDIGSAATSPAARSELFQRCFRKEGRPSPVSRRLSPKLLVGLRLRLTQGSLLKRRKRTSGREPSDLVRTLVFAEEESPAHTGRIARRMPKSKASKKREARAPGRPKE
ncbi:unnamed protein product [Polarella glacialis]|uniref:SAP domain-containing protein n=1 Tax=Polarella glacialis TaxID=89957 RepID=A0A813K1J6_POLGL|nr:unnamed protein product [Polarella glacialis]